MKFQDFELSDRILKSIIDQKYETPTPIQIASIPKVLAGHDLLAAAQTGTGKTASFVLPILHKLLPKSAPTPLHIKALILTPTRELAMQVSEHVALLGKHTNLTYTSVFGGIKIGAQIKRLAPGIDILVATPGRLLDLLRQNAIKLSKVEFLVLDEADRMLDMGFIVDIKKILSAIPKNRQTLMFSATFSPEIRKLANTILNNPLEVEVSAPNSAAKSVEQLIYQVENKEKFALTAHLIKEEQLQQVLVFTRTKHLANKLTKFLQAQKIEAAAIHGNKSQNARTKALSDFKEYKVQVLVATDIAARGLDIVQLPSVINFNLPLVAEDYIHRIGRTGRAGATGVAISLVAKEENLELANIEWLTKNHLQRKSASGFEVSWNIPETNLDIKPRKPSRPVPEQRSPRPGGGGGSRSSNFKRKPNPNAARKPAR